MRRRKSDEFHELVSQELLWLLTPNLARGPPLHISFDMIWNQATNLSDSKIPHLILHDSCDSKQDSVDSMRFLMIPSKILSVKHDSVIAELRQLDLIVASYSHWLEIETTAP